MTLRRIISKEERGIEANNVRKVAKHSLTFPYLFISPSHSKNWKKHRICIQHNMKMMKMVFLFLLQNYSNQIANEECVKFKSSKYILILNTIQWKKSRIGCWGNIIYWNILLSCCFMCSVLWVVDGSCVVTKKNLTSKRNLCRWMRIVDLGLYNIHPVNTIE